MALITETICSFFRLEMKKVARNKLSVRNYSNDTLVLVCFDSEESENQLPTLQCHASQVKDPVRVSGDR